MDGFLFLHRNGKSLTGVLPFNHCTPRVKLVGLLKCLGTLLVTEKFNLLRNKYILVFNPNSTYDDMLESDLVSGGSFCPRA